MSHGCPETHYCSLPGESLLLFLGKANCDGVVPACSLISSYRWWNFYGMLSRQRLFAGVGCCRWHTSPQIFVSSKELNHAYNKTQTDRQAGRQASRQAGRQAGRQTDRQADRQTDRQSVTWLAIHGSRFKQCATCFCYSLHRLKNQLFGFTSVLKIHDVHVLIKKQTPLRKTVTAVLLIWLFYRK